MQSYAYLGDLSEDRARSHVRSVTMIGLQSRCTEVRSTDICTDPKKNNVEGTNKHTHGPKHKY